MILQQKVDPPQIEPLENVYDQEVYGWVLQQCPLQQSGKEYLARRELSEETLRYFRIGQVGNADELLKSAKEAFGAERLRRSGLFGRPSLRAPDKLVFASDHLLFPFFDGPDCYYLQARVIGNAGSGPRWKNLNGLTPLVYNVGALGDAGPIFLCEGVTDVLSAHELGRSAFALLGAGSHLPTSFVQKLKGRIVYILSDSDRPGRLMSKRLLEQLSKSGIDVVAQKWPVGIKDANEYLVRMRNRQ